MTYEYLQIDAMHGADFPLPHSFFLFPSKYHVYLINNFSSFDPFISYNCEQTREISALLVFSQMFLQPTLASKCKRVVNGSM